MAGGVLQAHALHGRCSSAVQRATELWLSPCSSTLIATMLPICCQQQINFTVSFHACVQGCCVVITIFTICQYKQA